eukprot:Nitzschia sp. Nitz4//scaffold61_size107673//40506//41009//NITZ4_004231-RA/size107673-processed-gene-0.182-mRNA-1//-1//CDS//3329555698//84//frame0
MNPDDVDDDRKDQETPDDGDDGSDELVPAGTKRRNPDKPIEELTAEELAESEVNEFELDPDKRREVRKLRRVMANRRSARESRERRKKLLTDLQESVEDLTTENTALSQENLNLKRELASLVEESGGSASLSMIPNIQALLQGFTGLAGVTSLPKTSSAPGSVDGST